MFVWAKEKPRKASVLVHLLKKEKNLPESIGGFVYLFSSVDHILMEKQLNISQCCKLILALLHILVTL